MAAGMADTSWLGAAQDPLHRQLVFRPAAPLSDHKKACIAFLARISKFEIHGGDKRKYEITVHLEASADDPEAGAASYSITRTSKELEQIQRAVHDHCNLHPNLSKYHVSSCALCDQFNVMKPVSSSLFKSLESVRATIVERLMFMVKGALVPPSHPELQCQGLACVPSGLTKFLLRGVDQTKI